MGFVLDVVPVVAVSGRDLQRVNRVLAVLRCSW